jgi:hypothetical protein
MWRSAMLRSTHAQEIPDEEKRDRERRRARDSSRARERELDSTPRLFAPPSRSQKQPFFSAQKLYMHNKDSNKSQKDCATNSKNTKRSSFFWGRGGGGKIPRVCLTGDTRALGLPTGPLLNGPRLLFPTSSFSKR